MRGVKDRLDILISAKREYLGLSKVKPIHMSRDQAESLRQSLKTDRQWINNFEELIGLLAPKLNSLTLDEKLAPINIPWWNAGLLFSSRDHYDETAGSLELDATISHSYITQLIRSQKPGEQRGKTISVSNLLITSDDLIVLGYRGGQNLPDTIMTVPAGSVEYHTGRNPLFESMYAEFAEELGLRKEDMQTIELMGKITTRAFINNPHYTFRSRTRLSFEDVKKVWSESEDQREHKHLVSFPDNPDHMIREIRRLSYDISKANPDKPALTTNENIGKILPQCAAAVLLHYVQREGKEWARMAEEKLGGDYKLVR
ncbi:MAG: hypothetical protein NT001_04895 [Candidatus Woesearchaeota archaeon]|nr:hypothetical protein [Candidatus Woesearchaeota archaeon]